VQTLFFGELQFRPGQVPFPGMGGKMTGDEYFEFRIATVRHAMVSVLKQGRALSSAESCGEAEDGSLTLATHFKSCRRSLFLSLREEMQLLTDFPELASRLSKEIYNLIHEVQYLES